MKFSPLVWALGLTALGACVEDTAPVKSPTAAVCDPSITYARHIAQLMDLYCTRCHNSRLKAADRNGAPLDHDFDTEQGILSQLEHIESVAAGGPERINRIMPPAGERPSDEERVMLGEWLACKREGIPNDGHSHSH